jgi:tRNA-specific 2-thiouridylase
MYADVGHVEAQLRYRGAPVAARVARGPSGFALELSEPVDAVAPGQVAVLYDGDVVVGAGVIERTTG